MATLEAGASAGSMMRDTELGSPTYPGGAVGGVLGVLVGGFALSSADGRRGQKYGPEGGRQMGGGDPFDGVDWPAEASKGQPGLTSRLSVKHVVEVIQKFDDYKWWLVSEIGFERMLKLPLLQKIDLRMSAGVMRKVEVKSRVISIDKDRLLLFTSEDFHKNFGVPCGNRVIRGRDGEIRSAEIEFIKQTIGMNGSAAHNLKVAEDFINRDISEESTKLEKDCFQISFVIFFMGYLLSPGMKHEYKMIDFWGALANPELISQFNWCEYALQDLMAAVMMLQAEYDKKAQIVHLFGCHLFLQVFLLDNIDLGIFNMKHTIFPRIQCFKQKRLREMILMVRCDRRGVVTYVPGAVCPADSVCYTRVVLANPPCGVATSILSSSKRPVFGSFKTPNREVTVGGVNANKGPANFLGDPMSSSRSVGPSDFNKHLREICKDDPVLEELSLMLKRHNAKCTLTTTLLCNQLQSDMFSFAEKMVALVKERCRCCAKKGLSKCITLCETGADGDRWRRVCEVGRRLEMFDDEGASNANVDDNEQRIKRSRNVINESTRDEVAGPSHIVDDAPMYNNPVVEHRPVDKDKFLLDRLVIYAQNLVDMVQSLYEDESQEVNVVYFCSTQAKLPKRRYVASASFCGDPWTRGCLPQPPPIAFTSKFNSWLAGGNDFDLDSVWLLHTVPRLVRVNAVCVQQQMLGNNDLDHEFTTLVLRRFYQLDTAVEGASPYMLWREVLEPDFTTHVLAGEKVLHIKAVQCQLAHTVHDITTCRTFFVILDQGWAAYMWDMLRKEIHVLDPMCCQVDGAEQRLMMHEEAVLQIHNALFCCLNEFFAKWHCTSKRWIRKFPRITDDVFNRDESGICMIHAIKQYNGDKIKWPLTKVIPSEHPVYLLHLISVAAGKDVIL